MAQVATILGERLPLKLSPTFLQRAACPLCLKWTYIDNVVTRHSRTSAVRGAAAHLAIAVLTKLCLDQKIAPTELADEQLRKAIADGTPHEVYAEIGNIFDWVAQWRDRFFLRHKQLVGFEEKMAIDESFHEAAWHEAAYRGIVDVIHIVDRTTAIVTDYKSQPNVLSQTALDQHVQGSFYCWLVSKFYPHIEEFVFRVWYLRYGFYAETRRTRRQLELFEQQMLVQKQKIAEIENWEPIAGEHCGVCDFIHICPLGRSGASPVADLITQDQAVELASELRVKEEWIKKARSKLKIYVEHNEDPIKLPGYAYGFPPSVTSLWDVDRLLEILPEHGLPVADFLAGKSKMMTKLVKRAARGESELLEQLDAARTLKTTTKFRGYKLAGDDENADDEEE
jgi:hypothetical protein